MGNYRFRLSDMMPNAWFYKLKDMGRARNQSNSKQPIKKKHVSSTTTTLTQHSQAKQSHIAQHRHSYYFSSEPFRQDRLLYDSPTHAKASDVDFPEPPRKSSRRRSKRRPINASSKLVSSSVSSGCRCRATLDSVSTTEHPVSPPPQSSPDEFNESIFPEFESDRKDPFERIASCTDSCACRVSSSANDIIIDMDAKRGAFPGKLDVFDSIQGVELPPILTKPVKFNDMVAEIKNRDVEPARIRRNSAKKFDEKDVHRLSVKVVSEENSSKTEKEQRGISHSHRRSSATSPGVKIRAYSPRIACKKIQAYNNNKKALLGNSKLRRKNLSDSFAVVKSSFDPQRDFRESMVEMILENNIRASKDLEELLACYLSLNSNEYHDLIVKVFEQIWFDLTDIQL